MSTVTIDEKLLQGLARAVVEQPRATLQELARTVGISKATLYRLCPTREALIQQLLDHATLLMWRVLEDAGLETGTPAAALTRLVELHLAHRDFMNFLMRYWQPQPVLGSDGYDAWQKHDARLDAFFLSGQKAGVFRIDMSAACLTDAFINLLFGMAESERRGRVARLDLPLIIERLFLQGASRT